VGEEGSDGLRRRHVVGGAAVGRRRATPHRLRPGPGGNGGGRAGRSNRAPRVIATVGRWLRRRIATRWRRLGRSLRQRLACRSEDHDRSMSGRTRPPGLGSQSAENSESASAPKLPSTNRVKLTSGCSVTTVSLNDCKRAPPKVDVTMCTCGKEVRSATTAHGDRWRREPTATCGSTVPRYQLPSHVPPPLYNCKSYARTVGGHDR
jgi:hypothetical protein